MNYILPSPVYIYFLQLINPVGYLRPKDILDCNFILRMNNALQNFSENSNDFSRYNLYSLTHSQWYFRVSECNELDLNSNMAFRLFIPSSYPLHDPYIIKSI